MIMKLKDLAPRDHRSQVRSCNSSSGDTVVMRSRREISRSSGQRPPHSCARRERADARIPIRDALRLTATSGRSRGPYVGLIGRVTGAARLGLCLFSACETGHLIDLKDVVRRILRTPRTPVDLEECRGATGREPPRRRSVAPRRSTGRGGGVATSVRGEDGDRGVPGRLITVE